MSKYFEAEIDGEKTKTLIMFLNEIAIAFKFPGYYGKNINAFAECINDLDWIPEKNYRLRIMNSKLFLSEETADTKKNILDLLTNVRKEWANVPNYPGEDKYRAKADFQIELR